MRVAFAGTPEFAACALRAIVAAGIDVPLVLTMPDRPAGRGMRLSASAVKVVAQESGIEVFQPATLRDPAAQEAVRAVRADVMVVAAYGLILPQAVLDIPPRGCLNIHASLLPRWRGAAPIQRAILAGDRTTGICIMQMDAGLDTGPVLSSYSIEIGPREDAGMLHDRLARLGAEAIVDVLARMDSGPLTPQPQPAEGATYAAKITTEEARLDFAQDAVLLDRRVRAFNPFPGATTTLHGQTVKLWRCEPLAGPAGESGNIVAVEGDAIVVACGHGALAVTELQRAGRARMGAAEFVRGTGLRAGDRFAS